MEALRRLAAALRLPSRRREQGHPEPRKIAADPSESFDELQREDAERVGASAYAVATAEVTSRSAMRSLLHTRQLFGILNLPEGSLYAAGALVSFTEREVLEAANVLVMNGIECVDLESRAAIIRMARNEYAESFEGDDMAGYYEDFPL